MFDKNLNNILHNAVQAKRAKDMLNSEQLTIGELILKLDNISNKDLPIYFDNIKYRPTGLDSWRGSYCELAIQYEGGGTCYEQPKPDCKLDEFGDHHYQCPCGGSKGFDTSLPEDPKAQDLLDKLKLISGKYVIGYKGGDFVMGKTTPVWVANYGSSSGFKNGKGKYSQGVVDITEKKNKVIINTLAMDY